MRSRRFTLLAILLCTSAARAFAAGSLTPLGDLGGGGIYGTWPGGVSADGSVVVGYSDSASALGANGLEAFRWTSDGGMVGLGDLPGGYFWSEAFGVSGDGSVVVGKSVSGEHYEAFRWTSGGGMVGLGDLPGGSFESQANGVSADGSVIVGYSNSASGGEAFRWTSDGGMVGLGDLPGGGFLSAASGVSADGSVVVGSSDTASGFEAFRWTSDGGMMGLGKLPGGVDSQASGISADGSVIVGSSTSRDDLEREAFRWTNDGGMVGLGYLPGGAGSEAWGVSGDGSIVVGGSYDLSAGYAQYTPFYWTADGGMRELWDVLLSHGVDPAANGWSSLGIATEISADGTTIVGLGYRNNKSEAFVAVIPTIVPEPASGVLALLGVSSILLLRRRSLWRAFGFSTVVKRHPD